MFNDEHFDEFILQARWYSTGETTSLCSIRQQHLFPTGQQAAFIRFHSSIMPQPHNEQPPAPNVSPYISKYYFTDFSLEKGVFSLEKGVLHSSKRVGNVGMLWGHT